MKIGVLSDTHGWIDPAVFEHFSGVDEIWHAGDAGSIDVITDLEAFKPLRAVWGNCDDHKVRNATKGYLCFTVGGKRVLMIHIGGYPGHYDRHALELIKEFKPDIFVCGHSHITRVIYDGDKRMLCINPGSAGRTGIHRVITLLRFTIEEGTIKDMEVIELDKRGKSRNH